MIPVYSVFHRHTAIPISFRLTCKSTAAKEEESCDDTSHAAVMSIPSIPGLACAKLSHNVYPSTSLNFELQVNHDKYVHAKILSSCKNRLSFAPLCGSLNDQSPEI